MIDLRKLLTEEPKPIDYCLPSLVAGTVGSIIAPGGSGKSFIALQIASQVAGGADLLGLGEIPTGKAVYLPVEDPQNIIEHRLLALFERQNDQQREALYENLIVEPLERYMPDILDPKWKEAITRVAEGARLLIIDTLTLFHTADENDNGEMKKVIGSLIQIASVTGCTILFVHHTAKGSDTKSAGASRGASVLKDNIRWQSYVTTISEEKAKELDIDEDQRKFYAEFGISKVNFGGDGEPIILKKSFPHDKRISAIVFEEFDNIPIVYEDEDGEEEEIGYTGFIDEGYSDRPPVEWKSSLESFIDDDEDEEWEDETEEKGGRDV